MDFGKLDNIDNVDFTLPPDKPETKEVLSKGKKKKPQVYVGCAKWGRKEWVGMIYPLKTKEKDFLAHYVKHFNSIELNATHYRLYDALTIKGWRDKAEGREFKFCPKFYQTISHYKRLKNAEHDTEQFYKSISNFGNTLGACFLQLPPNYTPKDFDNLHKYLKALPKEPEAHVELRHPLWFEDPKVFNETADMFQSLGIGFVITDAAGRRDVTHMRLTNKTAFLRYVGNGLHKTDYTRIDDWVKRIKKWMASGLGTLYFMMHQHDEKDTPILADYAVRQLNKHCKLDIPPPEFLSK